MSGDYKTTVIGKEYDAKVWAALRTVIHAMGAIIIDEKWSLLGSQELECFDIQIQSKALKIESETYIGVSISGESKVVDEIERRVIRILSTA